MIKEKEKQLCFACFDEDGNDVLQYEFCEECGREFLNRILGRRKRKRNASFTLLYKTTIEGF